MRNKGFVLTLTIVVTLLCMYYLSFTLISRGVQRDATTYATNASGVVDPNKKQAYLDSVWNKPVYNLFGLKEYTYKEIKSSEISLGLDLQGGMHVTLEVSPINIIRGLATNDQDSAFVQALQKARAQSKTSQQSFSKLFFDAYREDNPGKKLAPLFANSTTRGRINLTASDDDVIQLVDEEIKNAIDRSEIILRNRVDQFGTTQPNIQQLPNGRIQVEIPGAENPQRVRKLLQGVAKLEFWDVIEPNESSSLSGSLMAINDILVKEQKAKDSPVAKADESTEKDLSSLLSGDTTKSDAQSALEKELATAADSSSQGLDSLQNLNISPLFSLSSPRPPSVTMLRILPQSTGSLSGLILKAACQEMLVFIGPTKKTGFQKMPARNLNSNYTF